MILTSPAFSVPLRRSWFVDYTLLDRPTPRAQATLAREIFTAIREHEPRARLVGPVRFIQDPEEGMDGWMMPSLTVEVNL
ncbi:MAG: hypothetical protein FWE70_08805, partial [Oscillospiraceae bacterium]|nr:hypothetical protein [Oscillospiraceae bacterium]